MLRTGYAAREDGIRGANLVEAGLRVSRTDVLEAGDRLPWPKRQQIGGDAGGDPHQLRPERALDEQALGDGGVGLGRILAQHAHRDAKEIEDFIPVGATTIEEIEVSMPQADVLPTDLIAREEGRAALRPAITGAAARHNSAATRASPVRDPLPKGDP